MEIFDSTLRDGEQAAGVYLSPEQKASYAKLLEISGVDIIDSGFPFASKTDWEGVRSIAAATKKVTISAVATHLKKDIDNVRLALKGHESRSRLATRIGPEELYQRNSSNTHVCSNILSRSKAAVAYAKDYFPEVQYYLNYAGMRDPAFLEELAVGVVDAGATHVVIADSQSTFVPEVIAGFTQKLIAELGGRAKVGVHCHNMYGLAVANSAAAIEAGAEQVEVTVGGIGDAGGNTALEQIAVYAKVFGHGKVPWQSHFLIDHSYELAQELSKLTGFQFGSNQPIVGPDTFKIEAGIHQMQIEQVRPGLDPAWIGRETQIVLGRHSGIRGVRRRAIEIGLARPNINWQVVYRIAMDIANESGAISDDDLKKSIERSCAE